MANWFSFGAIPYISLNGAPYVRAYGAPAGVNIGYSWRVGAESLLSKFSGQVIRAIDCAGVFAGLHSDLYAPITVRAAAGATALQYSVSLTTKPLPDTNAWTINVPDTTIPLGLMRSGAGLVETNQWAGIVTSSFLQSGEAAGVGRLPDVYRHRLLLSAKPRWIATAPSALVENGAAEPFTVVVQYPDGTPVAGLRVTLRSEAGNVLFGAGSALSVTTQTDSVGRINIPVRSRNGQPDAIVLAVDDARCMADYFEPPLQGVFPVNAQTTTVGGRQCVVIPAIPTQPYVPQVVTETLSFAWDAGAYSIEEREGDCEIVLTDLAPVVGAVIGFVTTAENVVDFKRITHGLYFTTSQAGQLQYQVMESGRAMGAQRLYDGAALRLQRSGTAVRFVAGTAVFYTSRTPLAGPVRAGCSLFATGDTI